MSPRLEQHAARMRLQNTDRRLKRLRRRSDNAGGLPGREADELARLWEQVRLDKRLARAKWPALELEKQGRG